MKSRDIIRALERDGWKQVRVTGNHFHFRHPAKPGVVTVPQPRRDVPIGTVRSIERQSGVKLR
jgi:predicted RNA binding protein YcfA (HicA-like mRNA interferase family)